MTSLLNRQGQTPGNRGRTPCTQPLGVAGGDLGSVRSQASEGSGAERTATGSLYSTAVTSFNLGEAAARGGVSVDELRKLVALGIVTPGPNDRFTSGDVRRISMMQ